MDNSELPYRRSIRLKEYDYSKAGAYFVTGLCTGWCVVVWKF
ncbi:MAG TPA: hypothetical protein VEC36_03600 [Patescibacteria group bacterium]|nr:hypothetical protein [Patescibacteria group bacterium]